MSNTEDQIKEKIVVHEEQKHVKVSFVEGKPIVIVEATSTYIPIEEFKEDYSDADLANLKKVAKLKAEQKVGDGVAKANEFLEAVESYTQG